MRPTEIANQARFEHESLQHVSAALRRLIRWENATGVSDKKHTALKVIAESLQEHLDRLIALKEAGGYLEEVGETSPHLAPEIECLQSDQERFQAVLERIVTRLATVPPTQRARLEVVTAELLGLVKKLEEHDQKEADLLQEAFLRDEGGEG